MNILSPKPPKHLLVSTTEFDEFVEGLCTCHTGVKETCPVDGTWEAFENACRPEDGFDKYWITQIDRLPPR